ncbi:MAG: hypothetical protein J7L15_04065 [Clostridiales bacterium]|nr:hypothetical protein [Clostridiales bacterium]
MEKKNKKVFGFIFLAISLFFFSPIPDVSDVVGFKLYSTYSGESITLNNLSAYYLDYFIFTTIIALVFLILAINMLGWSWKRLWKKLDLGKYKIALLIGGLIVVLIAYLDIQGLIFFTEMGRDYTSGRFPRSYWVAFRNTAYILMGLVSLCYYYFVNKDKSETLAVFLTPFILFWSGASDILYFILRKVSIPETLPWLDNHIFIGWVSKSLGFTGVTNVSLIISVFVGLLLVFLVTKFLKEKI